MSSVLTFDVGKTGCRAALFVDGERQAQVQRNGTRGIVDRGGVQEALDVMGEAAGFVEAGRVDAVGAGITGLASASEHVVTIAETLGDRHGTRQIMLASDMTTSHAGALGGGCGVVLAAGTGSVALGVGPDGDSVTVDGWGYLLGDAGSGHAIGRAGLVSALREHDGRGGSASLARRAAERFGRVEAIPSTVHGSTNPAQIIASFACDVYSAASEGDRDAREICTAAGAELANTAAAAAGRLDGRTPRVALTGGLVDGGPLLIDPFTEALTSLLPEVQLHPCVGDACDGAYLLARRDQLPHEHLVLRSMTGVR